MPRLSVIAIIRDAYLFTLHNLGAVIGLIWVPVLLSTVMGFFTFQRYYNDMIDALASGNAAAMGPSILMMLGYVVAALLLYAVMLVSVVQLALGQRQGGVVAHFSFGALEWRMFRALAGLVGLAILVMLTAVLIGNPLLALAGGARMGEAQAGYMMVLVLYGLLVAGAPRFLALLPAVAVAETGPALRRSWVLSAGNFWRLLGVLVAIFLPVLVVASIAEAVLAGPGPTLNTTSDKLLMISGLTRAREVLPLMSGLGFLFSPILIALYCGAAVSAWRAVKNEPAAAQAA
jgi:hypothetical protein